MAQNLHKIGFLGPGSGPIVFPTSVLSFWFRGNPPQHNFHNLQSPTNIILGGKNHLPAWFLENNFSIAIFLPTTPIQNQKSVSKVGLIILKLQFRRSWWPKTKKNPSLSDISNIALWLRPSDPRPISFCEGIFFLPAWFLENHYSIVIFLPTTTIQNQKSISKVGLII